MCASAGVPRPTDYRHWQEHAPRVEETALRDAIQRLALADRHEGCRRLLVRLRAAGWHLNHKRLRRILREDNLLALRQKAFVPPTTDSRHTWHVFANHARGLTTTAVNQLWVADLTYIRLREEFVYLAVVLDAHSRKVIGWALARHLQASLAVAALRRALASRTVPPGLIHHSDRGVQYACPEYVQVLDEHGLTPSMSRIANPYDNAKAESFMKTLKAEEVNGRQYRDYEELEQALAHFLEHYYNQHRLHSSLGYQPPTHYENRLLAVAGSATASPPCP